MIRCLSIDDFRSKYSRTDEFALIDPREELIFSRAHLFAATNMPLSKIELLIPVGVPEKTTEIVLCDDGDGLAQRSAEVLADLGYSTISVLAGGLPVWQLAGGAIFSGMNVPSKAFGEAVERKLRTPAIDSKELAAKLDRGDDFLLLDARPMDEHQDYCIPGSISCPSAEMILRAAELISYRDKEVVVHCGGRTRAIIGAQTLIDSGLFKSVRSLWNGTPGWEFEGRSIQKGNFQEAGRPPAASAQARDAAERLRREWAIPALDGKAFADWKSAGGTRYIFDIRSLEEFVAGRIHGAKHVPGGQLLQTTERHIVVQNARILLIDSDGVRAVTCAMWLRRMGWRHVVTYQMTPQSPGFETVDPTRASSPSSAISVSDMFDAFDKSAVQICDLRRAYQFRRGHIPGAAYLNRLDLAGDVKQLSEDLPLILVTDEYAYGEIVLRDLERLGRSASILEGGFDAWRAAGHPVETGLGRMLSRPIDTYLDPDHFDDFDVHMRENHAYLNWEIALIDHIEGDPAVRFEL